MHWAKRAEDADGLAPIKDENAFLPHAGRKGCLIFMGDSYQPQPSRSHFIYGEVAL